MRMPRPVRDGTFGPAFTLVELFVVITNIAILASLIGTLIPRGSEGGDTGGVEQPS
jgi:type II secretory pathway pseudopilin PulG